MSAKLVFAWIFTVVVTLFIVAGVTVGLQGNITSTVRLGIIAPAVLVGAGLWYVMVRGKSAEGLRLAVSSAALVLCLVIVGIGAFLFYVAALDM
jgi:cytochrome bd-type quinol oxidase subunit 2